MDKIPQEAETLEQYVEKRTKAHPIASQIGTSPRIALEFAVNYYEPQLSQKDKEIERLKTALWEKSLDNANDKGDAVKYKELLRCEIWQRAFNAVYYNNKNDESPTENANSIWDEYCKEHDITPPNIITK